MTVFLGRTAGQPRLRVAIIGAGIAGLSCAGTLAGAGADVTLFDKGRAPGGRIATRRAGALQFDHGAQYCTARDPAFVALTEGLVRRGVLAPWAGRVRVVEDGQLGTTAGDVHRMVGVPGMSAVPRALAQDAAAAGAELHVGVRIVAATRVVGRRGPSWQLTTDAGAMLGPFDVVLATAPAAQTAELLRAAAPAVAARVDEAEMLPCWAALAAFDFPLSLPFDAAFVRGGPLSWVARDSDKPGRPAGEADTWVLHAAPDWSAEHLEAPPGAIAPALLSALAAATGRALPPPTYLAAHRWRFALPAEPLPERHLWDGDVLAGAAGDWCGGPRVEGAWLSGQALAAAVIGALRG